MNWLIGITIFNTLIALFVLFKVFPSFFRLEFKIQRTFWANIPLHLDVYFWRNGSGTRLFHIPLRLKPLGDLEDWHTHKLEHFAYGCKIGGAAVFHTDECFKKRGCLTGNNCGNMAFNRSELEWNEANLPKKIDPNHAHLAKA